MSSQSLGNHFRAFCLAHGVQLTIWQLQLAYTLLAGSPGGDKSTLIRLLHEFDTMPRPMESQCQHMEKFYSRYPNHCHVIVTHGDCHYPLKQDLYCAECNTVSVSPVDIIFNTIAD